MKTATHLHKLQWRSPHGRALPDGARTLIMGILNVTPDSFSDGGKFIGAQAALERAGAMLAEGADVIDIGGESTRPGHAPVSEAAEIDRVLPVIEAVRGAFPEAAISADTYKAGVARAAVRGGADIINDVWGGRFEGENMAQAAADLRCPIILMHNRPASDYTDFWPDVIADLRASIDTMLGAGVEAGQIWTDPGFGFAKNVAQNLEVLKHLSRIVDLGHPVLLATSRKSTIGSVLKKQIPTEREDGTAATLVWGVQQGARMVRVHDVARMRPFVEMADAIRAGAEWTEVEKL
ncbi:dihydropteroate synthase [Ereboglobus sp. PH5-5]|uniref:dihydropteroate synthase n=1 Tax=Ereboglobus sp. PH5-5 TaxID=2940529 RepID=UPI0024069207|nr:dihydropteroate synthase [Ereboglobus sp. PH5-5]MDF9833875.1 dihydropteroate synthase [Ereboglobus sp. PH5-5]